MGPVGVDSEADSSHTETRNSAIGEDAGIATQYCLPLSLLLPSSLPICLHLFSSCSYAHVAPSPPPPPPPLSFPFAQSQHQLHHHLKADILEEKSTLQTFQQYVNLTMVSIELVLLLRSLHIQYTIIIVFTTLRFLVFSFTLPCMGEEDCFSPLLAGNSLVLYL